MIKKAWDFSYLQGDLGEKPMGYRNVNSREFRIHDITGDNGRAFQERVAKLTQESSSIRVYRQGQERPLPPFRGEVVSCDDFNLAIKLIDGRIVAIHRDDIEKLEDPDIMPIDTACTDTDSEAAS